jgi:putative FmdB family regulatory protein
MPIYSYRCKQCSHNFDILVGVTADSAELKCAKCGSSQVEKTLGCFAVRMGSSKSNPSPCSSGSCCPTC